LIGSPGPLRSRLLEAGVDVRFADLPAIEGATGQFKAVLRADIRGLRICAISRPERVQQHSVQMP
jgi:hypothetical protein